METLATLLPALLTYTGDLASLALVIVFVYVFKKNGSGGTGKIQNTIDTISENHLAHMQEDMKGMNTKMDVLITNSAVQTEILREVRDSLRK